MHKIQTKTKLKRLLQYLSSKARIFGSFSSSNVSKEENKRKCSSYNSDETKEKELQ